MDGSYEVVVQSLGGYFYTYDLGGNNDGRSGVFSVEVLKI